MNLLITFSALAIGFIAGLVIGFLGGCRFENVYTREQELARRERVHARLYESSGTYIGGYIQ